MTTESRIWCLIFFTLLLMGLIRQRDNQRENREKLESIDGWVNALMEVGYKCDTSYPDSHWEN